MLASLGAALLEHLASGPAGAAELTRSLGISQPTLSRLITALEREGRIVRIGATRGARYGAAHAVDAVGSRWMIYRIDQSGELSEIGPLHALEKNRYYAPRGPQRMRGLAEGVPYFLEDARPGGFLGRTIPRAFPELALPERIADWTDEHFITFVTQRGSDLLGDLILGERSVERYLDPSTHACPMAAEDRAVRYPEQAAAAMAGTPAGSSAHGEQPKFLAQLRDGRRSTHVLVKFSPPLTTAVGRRWGDLLVCEHLAHELLARAGLPACSSKVFVFGDRTYLEVERFDRIDSAGRRGTVSLYAIDLARYGKLDNWSACAQRLDAERLLAREDAQRIRLLESFAMLIGNTDRHFGNITLFDRYQGPLELAPVYDMLPMLFAPQHEQLVERAYAAPRPTAASLTAWPHARDLAEEYWALLVGEERLSGEFRELSARALATLRAH